MLLHDVVILAPTTQQATMNFRMQGFNAAIHHFRKTGVFGDFFDVQAGFAK